MSKQQLISNLIADAPDNKLDIILASTAFVLRESDEGINSAFLSEPSLAKGWLLPEGDIAWSNL